MFKKLKLFSIALFVVFMYCGIFSLLFSGLSNDSVTVSVQDGIKLPVIMYHSVLKDSNLSGKYVITPDTLKEDISFLINNGYTFVSAQEIIDYVYSDGNLPEKPVLLTFDDGFYNTYGYVLPILKEYDAKAIISIVGSYTDEYSESKIKNLTYGYMSWSEVYDIFLSNYTEAANHSYNFHSNTNGRNGSKRNNNESIEEYKNIFLEDTKKAQDAFLTKTGFAPNVYTYPFGAYSPETTDILKEMNFKMSLTCNEGINLITKDPDSLFMMKRYNRPNGITSEQFFSNIL